MAADLGRLQATIEASTERFDRAIRVLDTRLERSARSAEAANRRIARSHQVVEKATAGVARALQTLVGLYALRAGARFIQNQLASVDALSKLSRQVGIAADDLRRLEVGFELAGGTGEGLRRGLLKFGQTFGQLQAGTGDLRTQFEKLDPAFLRTLRNAETMDEALRLVADRMAASGSEQQKLQIAFAAFGRTAGPAFVEALKDGSASLDEMNEELERLGVGVGLDETGPKVERLNDSFTRMEAVLNDNFLRGLFGTGDGLDRISEAVGDGKASEGIRSLAQNFGRLVGFLVEIETQELAAWGDFFESLRVGDGFFAALDRLNEGLLPLENIREQIVETERSIENSQRKLRALGDVAGAENPATAGPVLDNPDFNFISNAARRRAIESERERLIQEGARLQRLRFQAQSRQPFVGPPEPLLKRPLGVEVGSEDEEAQLTAGEKKLAAARERVLSDQAKFTQKMRVAGGELLTEAQKVSLDLADRLGKIGAAVQEGTLSASEGREFQIAAIREAGEAIAKAEQDALEAQQADVLAFLDQYGIETVSEAERVAQAVQDALDKIPGLTPEQRADLEASANARIERDRVTTQRSVRRDLLTFQAGTEGEGVFGVSKQTEQEIARIDAILESAALDEKISKAFAGDPDLVAQLQEQNAALLESRLEQIDTTWTEKLQTISQFGEQVFADMVEGWVQGADVSFEGILQSFVAMLIKMEAQALASDIFSGVLGGSGGATSSILKLFGFADGGGIDRTGRPVKLPALAKGGYVDMRGRVAALPALAEGAVLTGEAGTERLLSLDQFPEIFARSGGDPKKAAQLAMSMGEKLDRPEIREDLMPGDVVIPDRKLGPFFKRVFPSRQAADGGFLPLDSFSSMEAPVNRATAEGGGGFGNIVIHNNASDVVQVQPRLRKASGPGMEQQIEFKIVKTLGRHIERGGSLGRRLEPEGPITGGLR